MLAERYESACVISRVQHVAAGGSAIRVAVFTETWLPKLDGIVSILRLMLQRLQEQGHDVLLFGPPGGPSTYAGAEIVGVGGPRLPFYPEVRINIPRRAIWERLKTFRPDLVHIAGPFFLGPFGFAFAQRLDAPIVASYHTNIPRYYQHYYRSAAGLLEAATWWYLRTLHNQAHVNLCPSSAMLAELRAHGFKRVRWWQRGVDTQRFTPGPRDEALRRRLTDGHPEEFLVLNVGRHAPEKRLESIRPFLFQHEGVRLAMIGDGPSHAHLRTVFRDTPTIFTGYLQGDALVAAYRSADAFLFPSTTETFGLVALEAMACGLPVIAARTGGVLDIVTDGRNGFFFDPDEPQQIGPLIARLQQHGALRAALAHHALHHARSRDWRMTMDQLIHYYHLAISVAQRQARHRSR